MKEVRLNSHMTQVSGAVDSEEGSLKMGKTMTVRIKS